MSAPAIGVKCFDLAFAPRTASANPVTDVVEDAVVSIDLVTPFLGCPATADAEVRVTDASGGVLDDEAFYVQFDG